MKIKAGYQLNDHIRNNHLLVASMGNVRSRLFQNDVFNKEGKSPFVFLGHTMLFTPRFTPTAGPTQGPKGPDVPAPGPERSLPGLRHNKQGSLAYIQTPWVRPLGHAGPWRALILQAI